jgi:hypothetical protein
MTITELVVVAVMAATWWGPTFVAITDLQKRERGVPRPLVWKWYAWLCVPVAGAILYQRRAREELDDARASASHRAGSRDRPKNQNRSWDEK